MEQGTSDYYFLPENCFVSQELMTQAAKYFFDNAERDRSLSWWEEDDLKRFVDIKYEEEREAREARKARAEAKKKDE